MITEQEYEDRLIKLHKKADELGASFEHELRGCKHLQDFWYGGKSVAEIKYRGYAICFDVCGVIHAVLYDGENPVAYFDKKSEDVSFIDDDEVVEKLVDDETYLQKVRNGDLIFGNNNWINVVIIKYRGGTWDVVSEPEVAEGTNLLDEIESGFDEYVARIDKLVAEGGSKNESDD